MRTHSYRSLLITSGLAVLGTQFSAAQGTGSQLPATATTQSVSTLPSAQPSGAGTRSTTTANVTWTGSLLSIKASGESLPDILRQVARATGMKIHGSAPAEAVFGSYGPATVQQVMALLFDGLNVNMLLVNDTAVKPKELVLSARTGGASPATAQSVVSLSNDEGNTNPTDANLMPPPHAGRHTSAESFQGTQAQSTPTQNVPQPNAAFQGSSQPTGSSSLTPSVPLNDNSGNNGASTAVDSDGTQQSPNGVRTPEQIFEELQRRQQAATK